jgi:alkylated DNA nucleotide flippase Atl1
MVGMSSGKKRYSVAIHGWLAKALGYPRGARMIGWIMNESAQGVPAQRVINSKGELSGSWAFGQSGTMRQLLEAEGIVFSAVTNEWSINFSRKTNVIGTTLWTRSNIKSS